MESIDIPFSYDHKYLSYISCCLPILNKSRNYVSKMNFDSNRNELRLSKKILKYSVRDIWNDII